MKQLDHSSRLERLYKLAWFAVIALFAKTLLAIIVEYRWYFPPNFDASPFLTGRETTFLGLYRAAFYTHIVAGPVAIILGAWLVFTGKQKRYVNAHRRVGKLQVAMVLFLIMPTGIVMSGQAHAGPFAGWGFATLSVATAVCAVQTINQARKRNIAAHRRWAMRCFVLLCSPLLLRLGSGVFIVTNWESVFTYRLNAWVSWIAPLILYEWRWRHGTSTHFSSTGGEKCRPIQEAIP